MLSSETLDIDAGCIVIEYAIVPGAMTAPTKSSPAVLRFRCFGTFTLVGASDWSAKPARARGRELLQYLVAYPNGLASRAALAEAFWPELSIDAIGNRLHLAASGA